MGYEMASVTARVLFTCLVVAATAGASGQGPGERSDNFAQQSNAPILLATNADAGVPGASLASKDLLIASNLSPTGLGNASGFNRHEVKTASSDLGVKEWMLIAMGIFLIGAMSHRRSQSMAD